MGLSLKDNTEVYNGFNALYSAVLDSNVSLIIGVPGYPINSLMELFLDKSRISRETELSKSKTMIYEAGSPEADNPEEVDCPAYSAFWFTNEKVAMETALGASVSGRRALVIVKHVGMNLLSDPLITSVTHTIGAGLVVIAGDDPGVKGSQNEQDSRWYGRIAEIAVFDPSDPDSAYRALRRAYELSEETKTPVVMRITAGLGKSEGKIKRFPKSLTSHPKFDRSIWKNRMVEKHQIFHTRIYPLLEAETEKTDLNKITLNLEIIESSSKFRRIGIISSGFVSSVVENILKERSLDCEIPHLSLNLVNPLPFKKIRAFLSNNQKILVAEESEPFIEEQIRIAGHIYGKKTGHLPYGQVAAEDIEFALKHIEEENVSILECTAFIRKTKEERTTICDQCPYLPLYRFLSTLDVPIAGDMGCSVRSAPEPLAAVDVSFALGSAISVACGFDKKGIAVIGDFALAHSGILGLICAATSSCNVLVLVLQNEVAAMTGGQEVPDLRKAVEAIIPDVSVFDIDVNTEKETDREIGKEPFNSKLRELIRVKVALPGISVLFIKGKCKKY
jgi:indolepyruvate ferredoxin oxidoreductase, alpha subunit